MYAIVGKTKSAFLLLQILKREFAMVKKHNYPQVEIHYPQIHFKMSLHNTDTRVAIVKTM